MAATGDAVRVRGDKVDDVVSVDGNGVGHEDRDGLGGIGGGKLGASSGKSKTAAISAAQTILPEKTRRKSKRMGGEAASGWRSGHHKGPPGSGMHSLLEVCDE